MNPYENFETAFLKVYTTHPQLERGKGRMVVSAVEDRTAFNKAFAKPEPINESINFILSLEIERPLRPAYRELARACFSSNHLHAVS